MRTPGSGRPKGGLNKQTKELQALMYGPKGPFKTLLDKMNAKGTAENVVIDCAKALLQYTNKKMPVEMETTNEHRFPDDIKINLVKPK